MLPKPLLSLLLLVVLPMSLALAQPCDPVNKNTFSSTFPASDALLDVALATTQTNAGDFAVLGLRQVGSSSSTDFKLVFSKFDPAGNLALPPTLLNLKLTGAGGAPVPLYSPGGTGDLPGSKIIEVKNAAGVFDGYAFCARAKNPGGGNVAANTDVVLGRLDANGGMVWVKNFTQFSAVNDVPIGLFQSETGTDLILFVHKSPTSNTGALSVLTVNYAGTSCTQADFSPANPTNVGFVAQAVARLNGAPNNAKYAVGGKLTGSGCVLYLDASLNLLYSSNLLAYNFDGTTNSENVFDVKQDGNFLAVTGTAKGNGNFFLAKLQASATPNVNVVWSKQLKATTLANPSTLPYSLEVLPTGGYGIAGRVAATGLTPRAFLLQANSNGIFSSVKYFSGGMPTTCLDHLNAADGGYFLAGADYAADLKTGFQLAVKTDQNGRLADCDCWDDPSGSVDSLPNATFLQLMTVTKSTPTCTGQEVKDLNASLPPDQVWCDQFTVGGGCVASFTTSVGDCGQVQFTNTSTIGGTASWSWTFPGAAPSSSSAQNPSVFYPACGGIRVACLTVSNSANPPLQCTFCDTFPVPGDMVPPVLTCPPPAAVACGSSFDPALTGIPIFNDNCGNGNVTLGFFDLVISGSSTCSGQIRRTWTATDPCGNSSDCIQLIDIFDPQAPTALCHASLVVNLDNTGTATLSPGDVDAGSFDNCGTVALSLSPNVFTCADACQERQVTLTVTDCAGNQSSCVANVLVQDGVPMQVFCPPNAVFAGAGQPCVGASSGLALGVIDNCGVISVTYQISGSTNATGTGDVSGTNFNGGTSTVTYVATELPCGEELQCSFTVTVDCLPGGQNGDPCGWTVATCWAENAAEAVAGLFDTRFNSIAPPGDDWGTTIPTLHPTTWTKSALGNVFGIALDGGSGDIFLAATDVYRLDFSLTPAAGSGGTAGIYRSNFNSLGTIAPIVTTLSASSLAAYNSGNQLPNKGGVGNGIGNIAYDLANDQIFATNLEDGIIYRLDANTGALKSAYNPFAADSGVDGFQETIDERLWGIGVTEDPGTGVVRVYFTREGITASAKGVYFVELTALGEFNATPAGPPGLFSGTPNTAIASVPGSQRKLTDLEFSQDGNRMLLCERGDPHQAGVFEYVLSGGIWTYDKQFYVGPGGGKNSAGGVDYGYKEENGNPLAPCDSMVWASGNCLEVNAIMTTGCEVYGLEGMSASGNPAPPTNASSDLYVDFGGGYVQQEKQQIGDVDVFKCECPTVLPPCPAVCATDSLIISTGYDGFAGSLVAPVAPDPLWTLVQAPAGYGVTVPQPAWVIHPNSAWHDPPGSNWISALDYPNEPQNNCGGADDCSDCGACDPFTFERCFCICQADSVTFDFDFWSDDLATVSLVDDLGSPILEFACNCGTSHNFLENNFTHVEQTVYLEEGRYCLQADLFNSAGVAMGFNLEGAIHGASLERDICCSPVSSIVGVKFEDVNCDSIRTVNQNGTAETGLPGWTIQLCDTLGNLVATTVTDVNGVYVFNDVPPGIYVVKEVQQPGWSPSTPPGGSQVVTVVQNQIVQLDFGNCPPECLVVLEPEVLCDSTNALIFEVNFHLQNLSDNVVNSLIINSPDPDFEIRRCPPPSFAFADDALLPVVPPLAPTATTTTPLCFQIQANSPVLTPTQVCFEVAVSGPDTATQLIEWCGESKPFCLTLEPCCLPCEDRSVTAHTVDEDSCCHSLDIGNECNLNFFTSLELELLTGGVHFSSASTGVSGGSGWSLASSPSLLTWTHASGYVPNGNFAGLLNFCIGGIDDPSELTQTVVLNWLTVSANGEDSVACSDTLIFHCQPNWDCIEVLEDSVWCIVAADGSVTYGYSLTFQNVSIFPHVAYDMLFYPVAPTDAEFADNPLDFGFPVYPGDIVTITTEILPVTPVLPGEKLTFLVRLHDDVSPGDWCCPVPDTLCIIVPPCDGENCACGGLEWAESVGLEPLVNFNCNETATLPCLDGIKGFWVHGDYFCADSCFHPEADVTLVDPFGANVPVVFSSGYPHWDAQILSANVNQPGTYTLSLTQMCGDLPCECEMHFEIDPACFDTCTCQDFVADVGAGFDLDVTQCRERLLVPFALEACDQVTWLVDNVVVGTSTGSGAFTYNFPANGTYTVCMRVERHLPDGSVCPPTLPNTFCLNINVVCVPPFLTCDDNGVENGGFTDGLQHGHLGFGGAVDDWTYLPDLGGDVWALDEPGCSDEGSLMFAGGSVREAAIQIPVEILPNHDGMEVSFCYRKMAQGNLPQGTFIHLIASELSDMSGNVVTPILSLPLNPPPPAEPLDDNGWRNVDLTFFFDNQDATYHFLTVLVDNDEPENDPPTGAELSLVGFDNLCFRSYDAADEPILPPGNGYQIANGTPVVMSPNPVSETVPFVQLRFSQALQAGQVEVLDLWGRQLRWEKLPPLQTGATVDFSELPPGLYFVKVRENGEGIWQEKIVKQ